MSGVTGQLDQILQGQVSVPAVDDVTVTCVEKGNRINHHFLEQVIAGFREKEYADTLILNIILELDKDVESGKISNDDFIKYYGIKS